MRAERETDIVRACLQLLTVLGIPAWRTNSGGARFPGPMKDRFVRFSGADGLSDITGVLPPSGRYLAVECKRPGYKPTPTQARFLEKVRAAGGVALVAHSAHELGRELYGLGYGVTHPRGGAS